MPADRQGFTLVELLVVMAILAILAMIAVGILNPRALMDKANDATRKKDLARIKVAFEEYINDTGCYPSQNLINNLACKGGGFSSWGLNSWPCDPASRNSYNFDIDPANCPLWYRIFTNLENKKDVQIPVNWYLPPNSGYTFSNGLTVNQVNYGVSSTNVQWYDRVLPADCYTGVLTCYDRYDDGTFYASVNGHYLNAIDHCLVECCLNGTVCQ